MGITTIEGKNLVTAFNFNSKSVLGSILLKPYSVDAVSGVITIGDLVPANDIKPVAGATHVALAGAFAAINFETGESEIQFTNTENLAFDTTSTAVTLTPMAVPAVTGTKFFLLEVIYYQEVNGNQYALNNGAFNALSVIQVG